MKRILLGILATLAFADSGCFGTYIDCDGEECEYADPPPPYEAHPRYAYRNTSVYYVNGRYYRRYGNDHRWVAYRQRPKDLRHDGKHRDSDDRHERGDDHDHGRDHDRH